MKSERDWQDCPALEMRGIVCLGSLGSRLFRFAIAAGYGPLNVRDAAVAAGAGMVYDHTTPPP